MNLQVSKLYSEESSSTNTDSGVPEFANAERLPNGVFLVGAPITGKNRLNFPAKKVQVYTAGQKSFKSQDSRPKKFVK